MNLNIPDQKAIRTAFSEGEEAVVDLFGKVKYRKIPDNVGWCVRYGTILKTWAAYFGQHHLPLEGTAQVIEDLTGHESPGLLWSMPVRP